MGIPAPIVEEGTPPPTPIAGIQLPRTPTPEETRIRLAQHEQKLNELVAATERVWGARDVDQRLDRIEKKLDGWAQTAIRNDEMIRSNLWPGVQKNTARTDELAERLAAAEQIALTLDRVAEKLDGFAGRLGAIETEQQLAAQRAESHEERDTKVAELVERIDGRVSALEQRNATEDATARVRRQTVAKIRPWWWSSKGVAAVVAAVATAITTIIAATSGGCT